MAVYPSNMAPIGVKLWENVSPTVPDISFVDAPEKHIYFLKIIFFETLNGRLPLKHGSVRPQTLGKRVSDDPRHFIFRR